MSIVNYKLPCTANPSCGSSDAMSEYEDGGRFCHKCQGYDNTNKGSEVSHHRKQSMTTVDLSFYHEGSYKDITDRRITADVCKKYGVKTNLQGHHMFPGFDAEGALIAVKTVIPATAASEKRFSIKGDWSATVLFGANSFPKTGKSITVTEGEYDAMAAFRLTGSKYPNVSILNGCGSAKKDVENNFEHLSGFDNIVFNFDNDQPGKKATEVCAPLFPGKSKILQLVEAKDACDYLKQNKTNKYVDEFHRAKTHTMGGLVNGRDTWEAYKANRDTPSIKFPSTWEKLNEKTYGVRLGEIVLVTAGTGTGKTQVLRELKYDWLTNTDNRILDISLEEDFGQSAGGLMALHANRRIMLPDVNIEEEDEKKIHKELFQDGRILFDDHAGSFGDSTLIDRINYAATVEKVNLVFLDHITIAVSDSAPGTENSTMDGFMNKLLQMVKRLNICIVVVSHLRKVGTGGKSFEEGRVPCEDDLKGSGSLKQIAMTTIALARNKYEEDPILRNTTSLHVLKCRFSGRTGPADYLNFNEDTGRMNAIDPDTFFENNLDAIGASNGRPAVKSEF